MRQLLVGLLRPLLDLIHYVIPNYGWAIVVFTLVIKLCLMPLDIKSRRSMKRMNDVKPQIDALNAKYANDKEKQQRKTAELYKKEKINPLSGCLPMLLQFPLLFGMLWVMQGIASEQIVQIVTALQNGAEPIFQSWLWVKNVFCPDTLSAAIIPLNGDVIALQQTANITAEMIDSVKAFVGSEAYKPIMLNYGALVLPGIRDAIGVGVLKTFSFLQVLENPNGLYLLPVLAAVTQFLQTKLNPTATQTDPTGKKNTMSMVMQYFFPLFSLWICCSSNAAFAIYWLTANIIAIAQTFFINKYLEKQDAKKAAAAQEE